MYMQLRQEIIASKPRPQCTDAHMIGDKTPEGLRYVGQIIALRKGLERLVQARGAPPGPLHVRLNSAGLQPDDLRWAHAVREQCNKVLHEPEQGRPGWNGEGNFEWCSSALAYIEFLLCESSASNRFSRTPPEASRAVSTQHGPNCRPGTTPNGASTRAQPGARDDHEILHWWYRMPTGTVQGPFLAGAITRWLSDDREGMRMFFSDVQFCTSRDKPCDRTVWSTYQEALGRLRIRSTSSTDDFAQLGRVAYESLIADLIKKDGAARE